MSINSVVNDTVTGESVVNALKPLPPTISNYSVGGLDDTALDPAGGQTVQINGTGFLAGATITFDGSAVAVVTYVNPNRLTFTSPAKSAGTYTIYVVNADGGTAIFIPGIIYSVLPTWTTAAGTLGSYYETTSISNTVVASGDAPITYSLFSGSLPTGATLYANGVISGSAPVDSSSTTYSFTIQATDAQLQDSTRSFSLTINVDAVTWVSPANNTTYTSAVDSAIANVTLSATDAAGYAVSYSANALPTGLSLSGANITGTPTVIADSSTLLTATAATTNRTAVRTINWSITVANDPYFEYNTLLIPGASTTFVDDASTNNFAVSIFGDTKPNNFNPYTPGYYSNYFDGTGDYLQCAYNSAFDLSSSDFTIESWVCTTDASSNYPSIIGRWQSDGNACWDFRPRSTDIGNYFVFIYSTNGTTPVSVNSNTVITDGAWHHLVAVRSGNNFALFVDGVRKQTASFTGVTIFNSVSAPLYVGYDPYGTTYYTGYQSNTRLVKGTAVYDPTLTTLTVPTTPLTAIANTSLLTCQSNRFIDNSTNNFTLTVFGDTKIQSFQPFTPNSSYSTYGSGYFDGTGDYLTAPNNAAFNFGTGDFTVECWVYVISFTGSTNVIISTYQDGSNGWTIGITSNVFYGAAAGDTAEVRSSVTPPVNIWTHLALTRSSTTLSLFINGVVAATQSNSTNMSTTSAVTIGTNVGGGALNFTGYITDVRVVKGTAVYTTAFTPPSAPLTAIANTSLLTLQNNQSVNNNVFLDNSTNNFFVTRNGNTTQGTFSPYGGNWSNYFNGSSSLALPSSSQTELTTNSNFTFEAWVYLTGYQGTYNGIWGGNGGDLVIAYSSANSWGIYPALSGAPPFMYSGMSVLNGMFNRWAHVAITRSGNSWNLWVDGTSVASATLTSTSIPNTTKSLGSEGAGANPMLGYISNARYTSAALYTTTFTPLTTPVTTTVASGIVKLLTCQSNRFIDNSNNSFTLTPSGTPTIQRYSPFNPSSVTPTSYSGYFDGTGDYLTAGNSISLSGSFTIEGWVYITSTATNTVMFGIGNDRLSTGLSVFVTPAGQPKMLSNDGYPVVGSNGQVGTNQWVHIALVRNSTALTLYVNGTSVGTGTNSSTFSGTAYVGAENYDNTIFITAAAYLSNVRVGTTAVYTTAFTPSTTPLTAISGTSLLTCQSPTFIDNSTNNFAITAFGNSQPTQQNPFGFTSATTNGYTVSTIGGSAYFDGTGDFLTVPDSATLEPGSSDFTIECFIYPTANGSYLGVFSKRTQNSSDYSPVQVLINNGTMEVAASTTGVSWAIVVTASSSPPLNTWSHIAVVRNGTGSNNLVLYLNGISVGAGSLSSTALVNNSAAWAIGADAAPGTGAFIGYISDFRSVIGTAVYTSNFVPPSAPVVALQNSSLLLNMTSAGIYDAAMMNNMETVGDAKLSTAISKFGGSSMAFDGTGDRLLSASSPVNIMGGGDFTIEFWLYPNNTSSAYRALVSSENYPATTGGWSLYQNGTAIEFWLTPGASVTINATSAITASTWQHLALCRASGTLRLFINGTSVASVSNSTSLTGQQIWIGDNNSNGGGSYVYNGYIDDLRITRGYARYTANFTPPTEAFQTK